jgi:molecular chaperone GrpE
MQQQVEGVPAHIVLDVIEPGYIYKDKVIRHAKVIVSAESMNEEN